MVAEPYQAAREREVEDQLVQERGLERGEAEVTGRPGAWRDVQPPRQARRPAEQLLVEVVADTPDRLRDQQRGRDGVGEQPRVRACPAHPPDARGRAERDAAPDPQSPVPDGEDPVPVVRDVLGGGDVEVDAAADDAGRHRPQGNIPDQARITAHALPAALGDEDRERNPDHIHQPVVVDVQRAKMEAVGGRTGDMHESESSRLRPDFAACPQGPPLGRPLPVSTRRRNRETLPPSEGSRDRGRTRADERPAEALDGGGRAGPKRPHRGGDRRELRHRVRGGRSSRAPRRGYRSGLPRCRKGKAAAARMTAAAPGASVSVVRLDLASLDAVRAAAAEILAGHQRLDPLINNAGLMWPAYGTTAEGFEL